MIRSGHEEVDFFIGAEVEHTPAFGQTTLFVVGLQDPQIINQVIKNTTQRITHIYFGANQSFPMQHLTDEEWQPWVEMIEECLLWGMMCTLDVDNSQSEGLALSKLPMYNNFIAMISVKLPHLQLLGYNATIKLDDKDFRSTNPGVWCHSLHDLKDRSKFTDWSKYTKDEVIQ